MFNASVQVGQRRYLMILVPGRVLKFCYRPEPRNAVKELGKLKAVNNLRGFKKSDVFEVTGCVRFTFGLGVLCRFYMKITSYAQTQSKLSYPGTYAQPPFLASRCKSCYGVRFRFFPHFFIGRHHVTGHRSLTSSLPHLQ